MLTTSRFPMELIIKIANILYFQEYFVELESVMNIFPELNELFSHEIPTIVLIDDDQFDKFSSFLFSRVRPFGSRDLFIIRQKRTFKTNKIIRLQSRCYIALASRMNQDLVPWDFECSLSKRIMTLIKLQNNLGVDIKSHQCYEIQWDDPDPADPDTPYVLPKLLGTHHFRYSHHVGMMLEAFLECIHPRLLRFEAYSGKRDLYFEWDDLYGIYSSFISSFYPRDSEYFDRTWIFQDLEMNMPKCSFEFIKDMNQLTSLYQFSNILNPETLEWSTLNDSVERWLKEKQLGHTGDEKITAFFNNLKNFTVEKVILNETHSHRSPHNYLQINCSRSATQDTSAYQFVQNYYFFVSRIATEYEPHEKSTADSVFLTRPKFDTEKSLLEQHFMNLLYLDFSIEKLQSADITVFVPRKSTSYDNTKKKRVGALELDGMVNHLNNSLNLKDLESKLNRVLQSMQHLRKSRERFPQHEEQCRLLSKHLMTTIVQETTNSIKDEGLNEEQPLKLRVFQNDIQKLNLPTRNAYVKTWFNDNRYHR